MPASTAGYCRKFALACLLAVACATPAAAQQNRTTLNYSATITLGNTFQQIRPKEARWSITVQNNNTGTDNCWLYVGSGTATLANSILLQPGGSWSRFYPYVPSDVLQATCASTNDTMYVDLQ